jgi:hypothetical protein
MTSSAPMSLKVMIASRMAPALPSISAAWAARSGKKRKTPLAPASHCPGSEDSQEHVIQARGGSLLPGDNTRGSPGSKSSMRPSTGTPARRVLLADAPVDALAELFTWKNWRDVGDQFVKTV